MDLSVFVDSSLELAAYMVGFSVAFGLLAHLFACNPAQRYLRKGIKADLAYYFLMPIFSRFSRTGLMIIVLFLLFNGASEDITKEYLAHGYGVLSRLPFLVQAVAVALITDVLLYWIHRWFHKEYAWRYHAIHHSSEEIDWLSAFRFHPVNTLLAFNMVDTLMLAAGFSPTAIFAMAGANFIHSALVHANLNWTFGPFRTVLASPVFHRWHHTTQQEGLDKNFAPTFPFIDILFGTFYMPKGKLPEHFGVSGSDIPESFIGQLAWPFRRSARPPR